MKKTLLSCLFLLAVFAVQAQVKSTGVVTLSSSMTVEIELDDATSTATLTLTGPSNAWFALRFGSFGSGNGMSGFSDAGDVVYYNGTTLVDAKMVGQTTPSTDSSNDWTVSSNTTSGSTRTIVATRDFDTGDANDFVFDYNDANIDFAYARGSSSYSLSYHGGGNRGYSLNSSFTLGNDEFELTQVKLYPNPTTNSFKIDTQVPISAVKVYDVNGKLVVDNSVITENQTIDVSALTKGVYFVEVTSTSGVLYKKMIKE